ncbi:MAG: hypothetical protein JNL70_23580 [Saprospiraceae bacterium]|nr:hypothetical protein [Saprospiraceae bacterium]
MLTSQEWLKIKAELKKSIEPVFTKAGITPCVPFEQIIDIFQIIIEKEIGDNDLDDREKIGDALRVRYIQKDGNLYPTILLSLAIKLETYFKRLFKIVGEGLWTNENNQMKGQIVTFVKKHKYTHLDGEFTNANDGDAFDNKKFFKTDSNSKPIYTPVDLRGMFPFSEQFKWAYDIANSQRHSDPSISEDDLPKLITHVITCYLYVASKYAKRLSKELIHQPDTATTLSDWNIFKQHCGNFEKNQAYFLITDKLYLSTEQLSHFVNVKWDFVFDFDTKSDIDGLYASFHHSNKFPQVVNQIIHTSDDRGKITATFPDNTTFWYYGQGNEGRQKSLVPSSKIADWQTMYRRYTQDLMIEYYEKKYSFNHNPIKVIILTKDTDKLKEVVYAIKGMNLNLNIDFIFANEDNTKLLNLSNEISGKEISLPISTLLEGFRELEGQMFSSNVSNKVYLPCHSSKGNSIELPITDVISVKQYFKIIHLNILNEIDEQISDKSFYQGRTITWKELDSRYDVDRTITEKLIDAIEKPLKSNVESAIFYLTHYAGVGGTTIARRIAYQLHRKFPVLLLNEVISSYGENELIEKLVKIRQITEISPLVIVDNSNITRQQVEMLERVAGNRLVKTVFLLVESTFVEPKQEKNRFYIPSSLDKNEANRFVTRFSGEYKDKAKDFPFILTDNTPNILNPFYFGLIANENEYISIDKYVQKRIDSINENEKDLLLILSFCQIFAKGKLREVPHFIISKFLNIDEAYIRLKKHTQNHKIYDLIIETDDLSWRTIHPLIADNILKQLIGTNDTGVLNPYSLKDFAVRLIKSLRTVSDNRNEQVLELLHNLFILRGDDNTTSESEEADADFSNNLYNKKLFSKLINELDNNNNRVEVFESLTTEFPDENAHFWAHFARLHSIDKEFDKALLTIDTALNVNEKESDIYRFVHIKGMCYRTELYRLKEKCKGNKDEISKSMSQMRLYFDNAKEAFDNAREVAPQKEHGYIAFIQMAIQMIEFEYSISIHKTVTKDYTQFIKSNVWCRNLLIQANEVINDYKDNNQEFENPKIKEKQNLLLKFFGDKGRMIDAWQSLLDKKEFDQNLVRRQLAYAYLAKNDFDWEKTKGKDINNILKNIEKNLQNKVEVRDLQLWFEVSRRLNADANLLIPKVQEWEFKKPSLDTAYFLMCLFGVQAIDGVKSGVNNYEKYQKEVAKRINTSYSKVFCVEWVGTDNNKSILLNHKQVGKWIRDNRFFETSPLNLLKLKGRVIKYLSRTQGFIEVEGCGIQVMYQPALCNHFSDDAQKGTRVEFFVGFNYDGARAFEVKNI